MPVETRLAVHVLIHKHEQRKPSSTGTLIARAVTGAACHVYERVSRRIPAAEFPAHALAPDRQLWILHPWGEPLPAAPATEGRPNGDRIQIILLDGTWRQAGEMLRTVEPTHVSTAEALGHVLHAVGEPEAARQLRLHFELHVYATLLARGKREMAERYLGHSLLLTAARDALDRLHAR
jgi:DTW domain-containing protein YfiP